MGKDKSAEATPQTESETPKVGPNPTLAWATGPGQWEIQAQGVKHNYVVKASGAYVIVLDGKDRVREDGKKRALQIHKVSLAKDFCEYLENGEITLDENFVPTFPSAEEKERLLGGYNPRKDKAA